jgi:2-iminobutanoate/2-iminopropanoate deaminase
MRKVRTAIALVATGLTIGSLAACGDDVSTSASAADADEIRSEVFGQNDERGYSMAATYDGVVWTAGHLPESYVPGDDIREQTQEVMEALQSTLEQAGASFETVVMTNVYLANFDDWPAFNETYTRYFDDRLPPRVTVQVGALAFGSIEISMVAHVGGAAAERP